MTVSIPLSELIRDRNRKRFIESLLVIEGKNTVPVPFILSPIQSDALATETGRDIYVKPAQVGFSSVKLAERLIDTITTPGTNTVLIAYEDFITERLLAKTDFFYSHLESLGIPGFPEIHHNSTYEKTYLFKVKGTTVSKSSIYIASSGSKVAGRAEVIHHLVADEFAFWVPGSVEKIFSPALDRVPPDGTVDVFSTCNGQENDFHDMYQLAKEGKSVFTPHFYPWCMQPEYRIVGTDSRVLRHIPETLGVEFKLSNEETVLVEKYGLNYDQIRWRRWKILEKESLSRSGETRRTFKQEFPEDDVSCFLSTGDSYFEPELINQKATQCYPAPQMIGSFHVWYPPEKNQKYIVAIDPGQAKITLTSITVLTVKDGKVKYCARDSGFYPSEVTYNKAVNIAAQYNRATVTWEDNGHGLAISALFNSGYRPVYHRKNMISGMPTMSMGWQTTGGRNGTKHYMMGTMTNMLPDMLVHDIEFVNQLRSAKISDKEEAVFVGSSDIFMSCAIGLVCWQNPQMKRGLIGAAGWRW